MSPWPTAYTFVGTARLIIEAAIVANSHRAAPGTVVSLDPLVVATGDGTLELRVVRPEGKRAMSAREFLAGHRLHVGDRLASYEN
jgi:methionyl-tRNA formyltransferase